MIEYCVLYRSTSSVRTTTRARWICQIVASVSAVDSANVFRSACVGNTFCRTTSAPSNDRRSLKTGQTDVGTFTLRLTLRLTLGFITCKRSCVIPGCGFPCRQLLFRQPLLPQTLRYCTSEYFCMQLWD